jgi:hypothetical protein
MSSSPTSSPKTATRTAQWTRAKSLALHDHGLLGTGQQQLPAVEAELAVAADESAGAAPFQ